MNPCFHCGTPVDQSNYCSWDCHVAHARTLGATERCPNGLPIACITAAGLLTECGHGDHETYLFPVDVEGDDEALDVVLGYRSYPQQHALIYTDGHVALTLYECSYALWSVHDGRPMGGHQRASERLSTSALTAIANRTSRLVVERAAEDR